MCGRGVERAVLVEIRRVLPAPPDVVWSFWTTREGLEAWLFPAYLAPRVVELDLRPGGRWRLVGDAQPFEASGTFVALDAGRRLRMRTEFAEGGEVRAHVRHEEVAFDAEGDATAVTLRLETPDDATSKAAANAWSIALNRLDEAIRRSRSASPS